MRGHWLHGGTSSSRIISLAMGASVLERCDRGADVRPTHWAHAQDEWATAIIHSTVEARGKSTLWDGAIPRRVFGSRLRLHAGVSPLPLLKASSCDLNFPLRWGWKEHFLFICSSNESNFPHAAFSQSSGFKPHIHFIRWLNWFS